MYCYNKDNIPHSSPAIALTTLLAQKFISEAAQNPHRFTPYSSLTASLVQTTGTDVFQNLNLVKTALCQECDGSPPSEEYVFVNAFP